jgi:hypothetical protein
VYTDFCADGRGSLQGDQVRRMDSGLTALVDGALDVAARPCET